MKNEPKKNVKKTTSTTRKPANRATRKTPNKKPVSTPKKNPTSATLNKKPVSKQTLEKKPTTKVNPTSSLEIPNFGQKGILIIVLALVVATSILAKNFILNGQQAYTKSYLVSHKIGNGEIALENLENIIQKDRSFIFVTNLNSEEEYNLEKALRPLIEKNELQQEFYIYPVDKEANMNLTTTFHAKEELKTPTILYYRNGVLMDIVKREDEKMIEAADFSQLLDMYEITK